MDSESTGQCMSAPGYFVGLAYPVRHRGAGHHDGAAAMTSYGLVLELTHAQVDALQT